MIAPRSKAEKIASVYQQPTSHPSHSMKTTLLLAALFAFTSLAPAADKEEAKKDRKDRNEKKDDKKDPKKEEVRHLFDVTVEGAKDAAAEADVKTFLQSIEGVKVDKCEKTDKGMEAVLSTKTKISRSDVSKALKDNKDLKVSDFKAVRPGREKKEDAKTEEKKAS